MITVKQWMEPIKPKWEPGALLKREPVALDGVLVRHASHFNVLVGDHKIYHSHYQTEAELREYGWRLVGKKKRRPELKPGTLIKEIDAYEIVEERNNYSGVIQCYRLRHTKLPRVYSCYENLEHLFRDHPSSAIIKAFTDEGTWEGEELERVYREGGAR